MKAKIKNKIIALARNDKFYTGLLIGFLIIGILFIIDVSTDFFNIPRVIVVIFAFIGIAIYLINPALKAIGKQKDEVLKNNKLIYIILSEDGPVSSLLFVLFIFLAGFIGRWMQGENLIVTIVAAVIYFAIYLVLLVKVVTAINYYFSQKLNK